MTGPVFQITHAGDFNNKYTTKVEIVLTKLDVKNPEKEFLYGWLAKKQ